ncbi:MBL fold metallo-hydrolase [Thiothrix litoralis]|uniref:MBL fold metallo-hydrolase n=1 Tax=Thiothrix litoralis TaxID=2891210 RepID=A0ABX7WXB1_9GAMM|nr:MBL fold metallo-hydrolase [Thiothrix litoralis]QTR47128.1 MBL fold metallo-hydrolase [Thiothrix litoralis]
MKKVPKKLLLLSSSLLVGLSLTAGAEDKKVHQGLLDKYQPEKISGHVYVIHGPMGYPDKENQGFMNNPGFIVTDKEVAVIDPGSSSAIGRAVLAHIRKITDKPITQVFTTHVHGDHWLGNQAFQEENPDVKFYAHPAMIEEAKNGAAEEWIGTMDSMTEKATEGTQAIIPTEALTDGQSFDLGGLTLKAHLIEGKAHTDTDVMFEVPEEKVLFTGDTINNKRIVRMDDGSFAGGIKAADYALTLGVDKIVPGHGHTGSKNVLTYYRDYLNKVYSSVKDLREQDMEAFEMKPKIEEKLTDYKDWQGLDEELGKHISLSVLEAEQEDF